MLERAITFLLQLAFALSIATVVLTWLALGFTIVVFIRHVCYATGSADPFEWSSYIRAIPRDSPPAEIAVIQLWQRRIWRAFVVSIGTALVFAVLVGLFRSFFGA